ncbi:MAG: GDP-mannose 4,6-dehydratase [Candidatus Omnitrophica bacterium]|nr:GDP-mannose 4,6-dehydratase [Candidatus Omnitrophota bacterium]
MKFLVTGGAGFIGSHLSDLLLQQGHQVVALDNLSTGRVDNIAHVRNNPNFQLVVGSILDERLVDKYAERCDGIFHLAAAVGVELIVKKPLESLWTNIRGSEVVLEMANRYQKKVMITSTSEIYGKNTNSCLKEDEDRILGSPLKSRWSYSTSKAVDEILAYTYWKEKGLPTFIVRLFNTVGPRQTGHYGMVIPRFVQQALKGEPITVYGNGKQSRCFLYVGDAVRAMSALMDLPTSAGEAFNLGSQEEVSILQLAQMVIELTGSRSEIRFVPYSEAYEAGFEDMFRRVPDISKAGSFVGFKPTKTLKEILQSVIAYYRKEPSLVAAGR